ncbi:MAG TPA: CpsB/CapC family capsule biosynthesis tyrosine phosphatase [Lacipirellulaceae bacterium]|nr:CpsB/CapC family capsule biosynthesis tyrosine phosphatase [Lacipirellulaceae bacterium]
MTASPKWSPEQLTRLASAQRPRTVDAHSHCLPGLDDGPPTLMAALALCELLVSDGTTTAIATPHQLGAYDGATSAAVIRAAVGALNHELAVAGIPLEIVPGADVRVDERLPQLLDADRVLTLADARQHLLLELPHELYVDPLPTIHMLGERGIQAILTHPERYRYLPPSTAAVAEWVAAGAAVQLTAGSLLGDFGARANQQAWRLVHAGLVSLVASDAHDCRGRSPRLGEALAVLETEIGIHGARTMCLENPWRVLQGLDLSPCRPR